RGGHPSLDFVNTRSWGSGKAEERLVSYEAFLEWAIEARLPVAAADLRRRARRRPGEAARALARARDLRALVRRLPPGVGGPPARAAGARLFERGAPPRPPHPGTRTASIRDRL